MTRYFALALNAASPAPKTKSSKTKNHGVFVVAAIFVLAIFYLFQVNSLSTKGYEIKKLEQQVVQLKETSQRLELEARSLKSIEAIQSQANILNFVPSGKVGYMKTGNSVSYQR